MGFFSTDAGQGLIGGGINALLGLGTGLIAANQQKQAAKEIANEAAAQAERQSQLLQQQQDILYKQLLLKQTPDTSSGGSNTGLYIGLGVGGLVLTGLVVFLIVRNK